MGNLFSRSEDLPPNVVLVPPILDSRERGRSRFAKSSYDRLFVQPQLRILFGDFISTVGTAGALRFSPPEDERISIVAKLAVPNKYMNPSSTPTKKSSSSPSPTAYPEQENIGGITVRYQPDANIPFTFFDIKARTVGRGSTGTLRGCYFDPQTGVSVFGILPLIAPVNTPGMSRTTPLRIGAKYSSPSVSVGGIVNPASTILHSAWAVMRSGGLMVGCQTTPSAAFDVLASPSALSNGVAADFLETCRENMSWAVGYQPEGQSPYGKGIFTAVVQLQRQRELSIAFLHHMALQRNVHNPLEQDDVVGITNYVDVGCEISTDLTGTTDPSMRLAAAWQANKNLMLKGKVGLDGAAVAAVFKSWWQPAFTLALAVGRDFNTGGKLRLGLTTTFETYRTLRYERTKESMKMGGSRVTQRHVASEEDVAYHEGQGLLVPLEAVDDKEVLGQREMPGADYM